jgi:hypothetical protein
MTTKEIAEAVGKPEKTVRTWAAKAAAKSAEAGAKLAEAQRSGGKAAEWSLEESCAIIEIGLGKNAASLFRENARNKTEPAAGSSLTARDMEVIGGIVAAIMAGMNTRVEKIEAKIEQRQALLPAPQIKPRDNVNKLVREYAHKQGIEHSAAFGDLYREFGYRTNTDPRRAAKNRGMAIIDYIETEGMIETLEAVAIEWAAS